VRRFHRALYAAAFFHAPEVIAYLQCPRQQKTDLQRPREHERRTSPVFDPTPFSVGEVEEHLRNPHSSQVLDLNYI
jgi:hypothetical protein